ASASSSPRVCPRGAKAGAGTAGNWRSARLLRTGRRPGMIASTPTGVRPMRTLIACLLAVSAAFPAMAQNADRVFINPDGVFRPNLAECRIAMAAARDHAGDGLANPWPTLWVEAGDRRWPL